MFKKIINSIKKIITKVTNYFWRHIWWIISFLLTILFIVSLGFYLEAEHWKSVDYFYGYSNEKQKAQELYNQFARNFGWGIWVIIASSGLICGLFLTIWGRKTQEKQWKTQHASHLHERYEKAASMLGNEVMSVRVAGCRALMSLAIDDESMKRQCARLLLVFLRNPYLDNENKKKRIINSGKSIGLKHLNKDEFLRKVFPHDKPLRDDIQEAANSFFAIHKHYGNAEIDDEIVALPNYYLYNDMRDPISLINERLKGT